MKQQAFVWPVILALFFLPDPSMASEIGELNEHLAFLEPLVGQHWEGGYVGEDAPDLVISLRFEPVLSGQAVKYSREAAEVGYSSETHFYWSPSRKDVLFISLNSRGMVGEGVVSLQGGDILLGGESHGAEGSTEFRTLWHLDADGVLYDTFTRMEKGNWVHGHSQEFVASHSLEIESSAACAQRNEPMSQSELADFANRYAAAWSGQDPDALASFYTENGSLRVNEGDPAVGRPAIAAKARGFMEAFPDMVVKLDAVSQEDGQVVFRWIWTGTNTGPGGTGNAVRMTGYEEWTMNPDGLIAESKGHYDEGEYQRQLNGIPNRD